MSQAGLGISDITFALLCNFHSMDSKDIPTLHGTSLKETWFEFWLNELMTKVKIRNVEIPCLVNPEHQLLHSSLSYFTSTFDEAICFSWDPTGYKAFIGKGNKIQPIDYRLKKLNSCFLYSHVGEKLFGTGIEGAGKVMGLAPYGKNSLGSVGLYESFSNISSFYKRSTNDKCKFIRSNEKEFNATLAFNAQKIMEEQLEIVLSDLFEVSKVYGIYPNLCLGGGGALNSVANQLAFERSKFKEIHIHPASGDDGTSVGAGLWYWFDHLNNPRRKYPNRELMYSVASYDNEIKEALNQLNLHNSIRIAECTDYLLKAARLIADNKIVGWYQGASEIGPRSLGNRSILANPANAQMKKILNEKIKFRESFRPFAPSVLNEYSEKYFGMENSPFMLRVCNVLNESVPAITHIDGTSRIQTVKVEDNPNYYELIKNFYQITGIPLVLNTSFNIKGQPIVETPSDAIECFINTQIDALVFENIIAEKIG